ncbi:MAG: type III secretion system export apparatus subunit SctU, partial [Halochromatium sp.]|uniref:type III secretion system export apparatus subunit SctU n=1 Tax=Halochromatium sp. TaxID=2049430 RepID=UPI00397803C8
MAEKSGDQTEKPTEKKIRDSRKEGNVSRSEDLTKTSLILLWLGLFFFLGGYMFERLDAIMTGSFSMIGQVETAAGAIEMLRESAMLFLTIIAPFLAATVFIAVLVEFLQVGPLLAFKKVQPKASNINPAEGFKKKFNAKSLVEVFKSVAKTAAIIITIGIVLYSFMNVNSRLPFGEPGDVLEGYWNTIKWIFLVLLMIFFFVAALDVIYQRHAYIKDLMMSRRDIRDEQKQTQGDPQVKQQRQDLHKEWSQENMLSSVRQSNVVVTNPTHLAVALHYDPEETDLPVVTAKGEDYEARLIREEAERNGIPVMQDVPLARGLYEDIELEDYITPEFFEAVAQVLQWAES